MILYTSFRSFPFPDIVTRSFQISAALLCFFFCFVFFNFISVLLTSLRLNKSRQPLASFFSTFFFFFFFFFAFQIKFDQFLNQQLPYSQFTIRIQMLSRPTNLNLICTELIQEPTAIKCQISTNIIHVKIFIL